MTLLPSELPTLTSELLTLALHDLILCEKDPLYTINMSHWHKAPYVYNYPTCQVCLAGAIMAKTLQYDPNVTYTINRQKETKALLILEDIRCEIEEYDNILYEENPTAFKNAIKTYIATYKSQGN